MLGVTGLSWADGNTVNKIYDPYVEPLETEIEFRHVHETLGNGSSTTQYQLGVGHAIAEQWFVEVYVSGADTAGAGFQVDSYELELKTQLSEQGEYTLDYGLILELEKERDGKWEAATVALLSKELGRWSATANLAAIYEWGRNVNSELETSAALQMRYRYKQMFEPAIEYFKSETTNAIGPVVSGLVRLGTAKKLRWELGMVFGIDGLSADKTLKASLEYEF